MSRIDKINYEGKPSDVTRLNIGDTDTNKLIEDYIKSVNKSFSIDSFSFFYFFELIKKIIDLKQDSEGIDKDKRLLFTEDVPPETIDTRTITYFLKSRVPGRFDRGSAGIGGIKAVRPVLKQVVPNPEIPGEQIETYAMIYDNWVTFYVYTRDSHIAMKDVLWFEELMYFSLPLFESHGFKVIPEGVGDREVLESHETLKLIRYPMSFFVRHEKLFNVDTQTTKHINIRPGIKI